MVSPGMVSSPGIPGTRNMVKNGAPYAGHIRLQHEPPTPKSPSGVPYAGHIRLQHDSSSRVLLKMKSPSGAPYAGHIRLQREHLNSFRKENPATIIKIDFTTTLSTTMDHLSGPRLGHRPAVGRPHRARAKSDSQASAARGQRIENRGDVGRVIVYTTGMFL